MAGCPALVVLQRTSSVAGGPAPTTTRDPHGTWIGMRRRCLVRNEETLLPRAIPNSEEETLLSPERFRLGRAFSNFPTKD